MNPEVLCLHKPTMVFDIDLARAVTDLLREFVEKKGIAKDDRVAHLRRPRTCIITSAQRVSLEKAHSIYYISQQTGIYLVDFEDQQSNSWLRSVDGVLGDIAFESW